MIDLQIQTDEHILINGVVFSGRFFDAMFEVKDIGREVLFTRTHCVNKEGILYRVIMKDDAKKVLERWGKEEAEEET